MMQRQILETAAGLFLGAMTMMAQAAPSAAGAAPAAASSSAVAEPQQLGALAKANLAKQRPKAPFDLTGTWQHGGGQNNGFRFTPPPNLKLTPAAQKEMDAYMAAQKIGKVYHDDIGACWPAGLPIIMTRVWPIAMIQGPTAIYMISGFMNSVRTIFLDGRAHTDPDLVVRSFNGESIGHWEGDTLVVDTTGFVDDHHSIDNGLIATDALHIVERVKLLNNANTLEIEYTFSDPKSFEGEFKSTKRFRRMEDTDITEASCLPDLNAHMPSTHSAVNVR
jgi:hypothetical protein